MFIPARMLRAYVRENFPDDAVVPPEVGERRERVTELARTIFAREGRRDVTFVTLSREVGASPGTLNSDFCDIHALFGEVLRRHLRDIAAELARIPSDAPDRFPRRRAAYLALTRDAKGLTGAHRLLVSDRRFLPPDVLDPIEKIRADMFKLLAEDNLDVAESLLDCAVADGPWIETVLQSRAAAATAPPAAAAPPRFSNWPPETACDADFAALPEGPVVLH